MGASGQLSALNRSADMDVTFNLRIPIILANDRADCYHKRLLTTRDRSKYPLKVGLSAIVPETYQICAIQKGSCAFN